IRGPALRRRGIAGGADIHQPRTLIARHDKPEGRPSAIVLRFRLRPEYNARRFKLPRIVQRRAGREDASNALGILPPAEHPIFAAQPQTAGAARAASVEFPLKSDGDDWLRGFGGPLSLG